MSWRLFLVLVLLTLNNESKSQTFDEEFENETSLFETSTANIEASTTNVESVTATESTTSNDYLEDVSDDEEIEIAELERPQNLEVAASTQRSITLKWKFIPTSGRVIGYRIFYSQDNFQKVKVIMYPTSTYELSDLGNYIFMIFRIGLHVCFNVL